MSKIECENCDNSRTYDNAIHCMYYSFITAKWTKANEVFKKNCKYFNRNGLDELRINNNEKDNLKRQQLTEFLDGEGLI